MKLRKIIPMTLMSLLCLSSCGAETYHGTYKFLLGKQGEGEVRVGLTMELTKEKVAVKEQDPTTLQDVTKEYEKFNVSADIGSMKQEIIDSIGGDSTMLDGLPESFSGYYQVLDESVEKYGNKMSLGFVVDESLGIKVPNELIRNLVVTYVNSTAITLQVPVSIVDLQMQLAWYGMYVDFDPYIKERIHSLEDVEKYFADIASSLKMYDLSLYKELPGAQGNKRFGTHPSKVQDETTKEYIDQVAQMNLMYEGYFSNTLVYKNEGGKAGTLMGSLYAHDVYEESGKKVDTNYYYFKLADVEGVDIDLPFEAVMKKYDSETGRYNKAEVVKFDLAKKSDYLVNHVWQNDVELTISSDNFYQSPFTFRDFHDIKIQLIKE